MTLAQLIGAVIGLAVVLVVVFMIWRRRRLHLRRGETELEHFGE
jgi:uncharacterized membrane protein YccC